MKIMSLRHPVSVLLLAASQLTLLGCGAKPEETAAAATPLAAASSPAASAAGAKATVATAFAMAPGSGGKGVIMSELKSIQRDLREPDAKYDVFDTESTGDPKTLKQNVVASLDRGRSVLLDSDGTPESRAKMAQISYDAVGGSLPEMTSVLIRKAPEKQGGGYVLIPIYSKAELAAEVAKGLRKPGDLNNSVEDFFFQPATPAPVLALDPDLAK